jgi:hypothetical protein
MSYVIRILDVPGSVLSGADPKQAIGLFVKTIDVDAHEGRGFADLTGALAKAMRFATPRDAFNYWRRQSTVMPLRADGQPNRPGCAYTIEILDALAAT